MTRSYDFPIGASVTIEKLTNDPYSTLAELREHEPVSWLPCLNAWWITRRDLAIEAMVDADAFTVDDDRFTTAQVLGTSMLNLDGDEHARHRKAFTAPFRPKFVREELTEQITTGATRLWADTMTGDREIRTGIAGPLAVETILDLLGLDDVDVSDVLSWYGAFGQAITALTVGDRVPPEVHATLAQLYGYVDGAIANGDPGVVQKLVEDKILRDDEIAAAVAVVMFGAIETSEAMTANAFFHLLTNGDAWEVLRADRARIPDAINESLRLEPAACWIDRYATRDVQLGPVTIPKGELVTISLLGANRDPEVFASPDMFDMDRPNLTQHVTFVQGPHACLGLHVARAETQAAIEAALDWETARGEGIALGGSSTAPRGLIFRKAENVTVTTAENSGQEAT